MTGYESESTGAKSADGDDIGKRLHLKTPSQLNVSSWILFIVGGIALTVGLSRLIGWDTYNKNSSTWVKLLWVAVFLAAAVVCFVLAFRAACKSRAADGLGLWAGVFSPRRLVAPWQDVAAIRCGVDGDQLIVHTATQTLRWTVVEAGVASYRLRWRWRREISCSAQRPIPRAVRAVKTYAGVWVGAVLVVIAIRAIWWDRDPESSWYWLIPAIVTLVGVAVILLCLRVSALVWYATPEGLTGPEGSGRFVSWDDIRSIAMNAEDRKIQEITPAADREGRNRLVRVETRDRHFRLVLPEDPRYRIERLLVRHARHAAVFVEFTGDAFPPSKAPSLDMIGGLVRRARSAASKYGLAAAGYLFVVLLCVLGLAWAVWLYLDLGILPFYLEAVLALIALASGSAVGASTSWKHARLLAARADRIEDDFRDPARREELLRARQRFGIRGLWSASPSDQESGDRP